jgi:AhpD family alkylhydroperoxidase
MTQRIDYQKLSTPGLRALGGVYTYIANSGLPKALIDLVFLRASQINGCAYCIDMHWKDLRVLGDTEQRLASLDAWRECPYYSDRERAALEWTEALTRMADGHAPDAVYEAVRPHFGERELCDLTLAAAAINAWNRLSIAARLMPGGYEPPPLAVVAEAGAAGGV